MTASFKLCAISSALVEARGVSQWHSASCRRKEEREIVDEEVCCDRFAVGDNFVGRAPPSDANERSSSARVLSFISGRHGFDDNFVWKR